MDVVMPQLGETVGEGTISVWYKKVGDPVRADEPFFEVETEKVTTDIPAPASGFVAEILVAPGEKVKVGARLAVIRTEAEVPGKAAPPASAAPGAAPGGAIPPAPPGEPGQGKARLSPVVRRLLDEHGLDPASIAGTGADGRITRQDVLAHVEARRRGPAAPGDAGEERIVVPMSRIRKLTAAHMTRSVATSPHVLQAVEVDFSAVERARQAAGAPFKAREGFSLTYLPFVARAVCEAIAAYPHVNASVVGDTLVVHRQVNLGIAVDLDLAGLVVPVIKGARGKAVRELAAEVHRLANLARRSALGPDDLAGGTYTISNSGPFGTLITAPIIHQPQVAILSTDGVRKRPVAVEGPAGDTIAIRPVGVLAQCFDHRAFDGAYSAAFLRRLREILEQRDWSAELT